MSKSSKLRSGQKIVLDANVLLRELVDAALGRQPEVIRCIQRVCARVTWSSAIKKEVSENAPRRFAAGGIQHLLGTISATLGQLESWKPPKLLEAPAPRSRDGISLQDAGLAASQKKYVEVRDRHLFVLMRLERAALLVTEDRKILSGRDKLAPYLVDDRLGFLEANTASR